jgi:hypothetical protein
VFVDKYGVLSLAASAIPRHSPPASFLFCGRPLCDCVLRDHETWFYEY